MSTTASPRFDDPAFYSDDPHSAFRDLRESDPVHWYAEGDFWVITRYTDIKHISSHPGVFTSERIGILMDLIAHREGRDPHNYGDRGINFMDPPKHRVHRRAVGVHFTPAEAAKAEARISQVVTDVLESLPDGEFDWISHVAEPIPVYIFAYLLGIPEADWPMVTHWSTTIVAVGAGEADDDAMTVIFEEIAPYLLDQLAERAVKPRQDLLTMLSQTMVDGKPLTEIEVLNYALTLLAAGSETTQSLISGLAACLDGHPDQAARLFADPSLGPNAVEETLRWWTPVMSMARQAACDTDVGGTRLRAGDGMLLAYGSANRDVHRFGNDADVFDVTRSDASGHLGFGIGEHFCMGAALARREGRVLLDQLLQRTRAIEVTGAAIPRESALVHTFDRLYVTLSYR